MDLSAGRRMKYFHKMSAKKDRSTNMSKNPGRGAPVQKNIFNTKNSNTDLFAQKQRCTSAKEYF